MKIELSPTQSQLLLDIVQTDIIRTQSLPGLQYRGQILQTLRAIEKKLIPPKEPQSE